MRGTRVVVFVLEIFLAATFAAAQVYRVTDLGTLGGYYSTAAGINAFGEVVGYADTADHSSVHAFLWNRGRGMRDLNPPEVAFSEATGINDFGQVVGVASFPAGQYFQAHAFLWTRWSRMKDLGSLNNQSAAYGINDWEQVVGGTDTSTGVLDPFMWTTKGGLKDLGNLGGDGSAQAISNLGQVVGGSFTPTGYHAFSWTKKAGMRDLGSLDGCSSQAQSVSDSGKVVGISSVGNCDGTTVHPFLWSRKTGMQDLGTPPGTTSAGAAAINIYGVVIGSACLQSCSNQESVHGFLWTESTGWLDLNDLIPADSGWVIENVSAINNSGQITGQGYIDGEYHAFLLTLQ